MGGRKTNLLVLESALRLIMAIPGTRANEYKQQFANILTRFMAGAPSLAKELQQNAQSNDPINVLARSSLNKRGREEVEVGDGGAGGWEVRPASEQLEVVQPVSGQVQLVQPGSGQVQMVQSTGVDPATVLTLVQCIKDMRKEDMQMQKEMRKEDMEMQEKNLKCIAEMQEKNLKSLLELQERSVQRVIDAEVKAALATALAEEREAVSNREKKALKSKMTKLEKLAKK